MTEPLVVNVGLDRLKVRIIKTEEPRPRSGCLDGKSELKTRARGDAERGAAAEKPVVPPEHGADGATIRGRQGCPNSPASCQEHSRPYGSGNVRCMPAAYHQ